MIQALHSFDVDSLVTRGAADRLKGTRLCGLQWVSYLEGRGCHFLLHSAFVIAALVCQDC